jgi:23S rRNA pseudouridine2604 synthase
LEENIRLNKFLSDAGVCSRRAADKAIEEGRVLVNGKIPLMGQRISPSDEVLFDLKPVSNANKKPVLIAYNKPVGIVCTAEKKEKNNIVDHIGYPERIYPIGRLDKDSNGLILLTNQGDLVNKIMRAVNAHDKEYIVSVDKEKDKDFIKKMSDGVYLDELEVTTRKCKVKKLSKYEFNIILTQGLNRQIRRMCQMLGYKVKTLKRVRIMNIELGDLKVDTYRDVTPSEIATLNKMLEGSKN